jgi:hypothetical protein
MYLDVPVEAEVASVRHDLDLPHAPKLVHKKDGVHEATRQTCKALFQIKPGD